MTDFSGAVREALAAIPLAEFVGYSGRAYRFRVVERFVWPDEIWARTIAITRREALYSRAADYAMTPDATLLDRARYLAGLRAARER